MPTLKQMMAEFISNTDTRLKALEAKPTKAPRTSKATTRVKLDIDIGAFIDAKALPSRRAPEKIRQWASAGNVKRLREYAGLGPRASGEGEPRVAVIEANRNLAKRVLETCFTADGTPSGAGTSPVKVRKARTPKAS